MIKFSVFPRHVPDPSAVNDAVITLSLPQLSLALVPVAITLVILARWSFGVGGLALTGSALDYDDDWVGRFEATEVSLIVIGAVPSVSYKVTDKLSLGLAVPVMYSDLELEIRVPAPITPIPGQEGKAEIDGDDGKVEEAVGSGSDRLDVQTSV